jgi:hypothetical protein
LFICEFGFAVRLRIARTYYSAMTANRPDAI